MPLALLISSFPHTFLIGDKIGVEFEQNFVY